MASLTHVCEWSKHGWVRVTAEEVARKHPGGTVSANSGLFMCELCGQYVTLTGGGKRVRYFKHSSGEDEKNCPERTFGASYKPSFSVTEYDLPVRVVIRQNSYHFELGLIPIPEQLLRESSIKTITISSEVTGTMVFSFERLAYESITYFPVGSRPVEKFSIMSSEKLSNFWPATVKGPQPGILFSNLTGRMIPKDSDIQVGRKYYLFTEAIIDPYLPSDISASFIADYGQGRSKWYIYEICANTLSENAAKFFLRLKYRLTDAPFSIHPIWPVFIEAPYVIKHINDFMIFYEEGARRLDLKTYPSTKAFTIAESYLFRILRINTHERQQLISIGNTNIQYYKYLWMDPLVYRAEKPIVIVRDEKNIELKEGSNKKPPSGCLIRIEAPFDGKAIVKRNGQIIWKESIYADSPIYLHDITYGVSVEIFQALDLIWTASYSKAASESINDDSYIFERLTKFKGDIIPVPHYLGAFIYSMQEYPLTRGWIKSAVRKGYASSKAVKYLKQVVISKKKTQK